MEKKMRLNYYKKKDMFALELLIDGKWTFSVGCACQKINETCEANFIHYSLLKEINHNLSLGYELECNYEF